MIDQSDLPSVDKLCRWLDIPFLVDHWTRIWKNGREKTLHLYVKILDNNATYAALDWSQANDKWKAAVEANDIESLVPEVSNQWLASMALKWPSETNRTAADYRYLEDFYNDLCNTQNLISATQRDDAKRLAEIGLLATQKIRAGLDAKNEMAIYHNIVKTEGFEPKNAKTTGDFDSVGELVAWLERRGWRPNWHTEPQDSVDFTMKEMQNYLKRLINTEPTLADQVDSRRRQLELANRLDSEDEDDYDDDSEVSPDYEGAAELEEELDALN